MDDTVDEDEEDEDDDEDEEDDEEEEEEEDEAGSMLIKVEKVLDRTKSAKVAGNCAR